MKKLLLMLFVAFAMQSCSENLVNESVENTSWVLTEWPGRTLPTTDRKATLTFGAANKVSGKSFCNGFGGTATTDGNKIKISELLGTMMFCEDVGEAEKYYNEGLKSATNFKVVRGRLQLLEGDKILMVFTKTQ